MRNSKYANIKYVWTSTLEFRKTDFLQSYAEFFKKLEIFDLYLRKKEEALIVLGIKQRKM